MTELSMGSRFTADRDHPFKTSAFFFGGGERGQKFAKFADGGG